MLEFLVLKRRLHGINLETVQLPSRMLGFLVLKRRLHGINLETVQLPLKNVGVSGSQETPSWNKLGNSAASPQECWGFWFSRDAFMEYAWKQCSFPSRMLGFLVLKRRLHGIYLETVQLPLKNVGVSGSQETPSWNKLGNSAASPKECWGFWFSRDAFME